MRLVSEGLKNKQIAQRLSVADVTVRHHLTSVFSKLAVADRLSLVVFAFQHGFGHQHGTSAQTILTILDLLIHSDGHLVAQTAGTFSPSRARRFQRCANSWQTHNLCGRVAPQRAIAPGRQLMRTIKNRTTNWCCTHGAHSRRRRAALWARGGVCTRNLYPGCLEGARQQPEPHLYGQRRHAFLGDQHQHHHRGQLRPMGCARALPARRSRSRRIFGWI